MKVYIPMVDALFEVTFAEHEEPFYLLGVQMAIKIKLKKYRQSTEDEFDESGIGDEDIMDIIRSDSGESVTNTNFETEADTIKDDDTDEDGSVFDDW